MCCGVVFTIAVAYCSFRTLLLLLFLLLLRTHKKKGVANVCWAAKHHSVPVVVLTSMHQVCPLYAFDQQTFNEQNAPSQILPFDVGSMVRTYACEEMGEKRK